MACGAQSAPQAISILNSASILTADVATNYGAEHLDAPPQPGVGRYVGLPHVKASWSRCAGHW